ncbi:MAG: hypothetical protein HY526_11035, partial [Betaproteobacteria bacterium]|nr:hypothetical protein [Betaproteobacteria bacterium]
DQMVGGAGTDQLEGGEGDDFLWGDEDGLAAVDQGADVMSGGAGNDYLQGYGGDDLMFGGAGSDTLLGQAGADYMEGGDGNDFLWGDDSIADQGNDTLDGGGGNDQLVGDAGNDTYVFGRGYGQDIVFDQDATVGNIDVVQFAADITPDDVTATQDPGTYNLRLSIDGTPDALIIANHYFSADDKVEEIRFADGTVWTPATIPTLIPGSSGNDILNGTAGADVFKSGAGSDVMAGGAGNDSYRYYRGDGADYIIDFDTTAGNVDKIVFAADILPADVRATRSGNNLRLTLNALDFVVVEDYFVNDGVTPKSVEQVKFLSNGTVWDVNTIKQLVLAGTSGNDVLTGYASDDVLVGLGGNDTLTGNAGNDTLNGGTGNDVLQGGAGNDVYLFARGDGQDTITDTDSTAGNTDTLRFAADISPTDVLAQRSSDDLVLTVSGTTDQIAVSGHFAGDGTGATLVENVVFQIDATVWDYNTIKQKVLTGTDNADTVIGFETSDLINGNGGNDSLFGRGGNDTLLGGAGADALYGEAGDDDLDGGLDVTGTDTLTGGEGSDIYRFGRGAGATQIQDAGGAGFAGDTDVLLISADVAPADLQLRRTGVNSLEVRITGDPGVANLPAQFVSDGQGADSIERIQFLSDGTIWYGATINSIVSTATSGDDLLFGFNLQNDLIHGLGGNDTIYGSGGNDTLTGGTGNDILSGEAGGDTYVFSRGDGQDLVINATSDTPGSMDVLSFASDILPGDVTPARGGDDLVLTVSGGAGEVRIQNYFSGGLNVVEEIRFANGTVWNEQTILTFLPPPPPVRTGTEGNDTIFGDFRSELLRGLGGDDTIYGGGGNDTFQGGAGEDWQYGSLGDDTYLLDLGDGGPGGWFSGGDVISDSGGFDVLRFGPGISSAETPDITEFQSAYYGRYFALGVPSDTGAVYFLNYFTTGYIEEIRFEDGTVWNDQTLAPYLSIDGTNSSETLAGTRIADVIYGFGGADTIYGGQGHDTLDGGLGSDVLYGEDGNDTLISGVGEAKNATVSNSLYGGSGDDVLIGGGNAKSTERLDGGFGNDILLGASGSDYLYDTGSDGGNTLMYGAGGNDNLHMDSGSKGMAIGGVGRDIISGGLGAGTMNSRLIVAFNKNDGPDDVHLVAPGSTISMGGGTLYSNLSLEKLSGGLKLKTGTNHYVFLFDWYGSNPWDSRNAVTTLQIVIEGTRDYKPSSSNPMNNKKIQVFDFVGLAAAFDAAGRPSNFNVANNLANYRLWGSDTEAIGGAIAYQYARTGSISSLTYDQMRGVISAPEFAVSAQPITTSQTMSSATSETTESTDAMMLSASLALDSSETETSMAGSDDAVQVAPEELTNRSAEVLHRTTFSGAEVLSSPRAPAIPKSFEEAAAPAVITGRRVAFSGLPAQQDRRANPSYPAAIDAAEESTGVPAQPTGGAVRQARSGLIESDELVDPAAQAGAPLFDRLNAAPRFHFEALAEFFAAEANRRHATLSPAEVALRWSRVRAFTETLGMAGMDEDLGAGGSMLLPYGAGASEAGGEWSLPVRPAVGLAEGTAAQLRRFEGLQGAVRTLG